MFERKHLFFLSLIGLLVFSIAQPGYADPCKDWFSKAKISAGKDCLIRCASTQVNMSTFSCPNQCDSLCGANQKESWIFRLSDLYPGLTEEESALAAVEPTKTLGAFKLSWKAEEICQRIFP